MIAERCFGKRISTKLKSDGGDTATQMGTVFLTALCRATRIPVAPGLPEEPDMTNMLHTARITKSGSRIWRV